MSQATYQPKKASLVRRWHMIDANGQVLGRLAASVAMKLMGKDKRIFAPHVDCGDFVVVVNAKGIRITGNNKPTQKIDFRHSGYPGGDTMTPYSEFLKSHPERAISLAVTGMLAKTKLRARQMTRLKVYRGENHPHFAQFSVAKPVETKSEEHAVAN